MKDLINWKELSRTLAGNETSITRNRIPKKYQSQVDELISITEAWAKNSAIRQAPITNEEAHT